MQEPRSQQQFSAYLLDQDSLFSHDQPIINFTASEIPFQKKTRICAWNQTLYDDDLKPNDFHVSPNFDHQKQRIQHFLATIRIKNSSFQRFKPNPKNNKKNKVFDNPETQKNDLCVPLNSTLITFPKSRSQSRKLQNEQKIILQKLYRKRQKSKVIPKQISINPVSPHQTLKPFYPSKNYLSKNRSFIEEVPSNNLCLGLKPMKDISGLKKKYTSSYYKKISGVFQLNTKSQKQICLEKKNFLCERNLLTLKEYTKKNLPNEQILDVISPLKIYNTIYNNPRLIKVNFRNQSEHSIQRIKENAKNSHLNRTKFSDSNSSNQMHLMGSTITKWRAKAQQKLQKSELVRI